MLFHASRVDRGLAKTGRRYLESPGKRFNDRLTTGNQILFRGGSRMGSLPQKNVLLCRVSAATAFFALCVSLLFFLAPPSSFSQGNEGRITGTITDQTGGAIAEATVTVSDVARGVTRTLTTDDSGEYNAPNLLPGEY